MASGAREHERIVVGVDGTPAAAAALRWAVRAAGRSEAHVEAVIAWRPVAALGPPAGHPPAGASSSLEQREEDAEVVLEGALRDLAREGVAVDRRVMRGSPHRVLVEAADGASMLVIGGRSGKLAGNKPWSTGRQVVHDAQCPVVVVPAAAS